jgi:hypothetical protein
LFWTQRTKSVRPPKLQFEQRESRLPLAGNVTVALSGATDLKITGDDAENDIDTRNGGEANSAARN